jgi:ATP synthase protein I
MQEEPDRSRLDALGKRLKELKKPEGPEAPTLPGQKAHGQASMAWRMVLELVVGIAMGFGIGFGLDALFGTEPVLMILFCLFGFAGGVRTMMYTAKEVQEAMEKEAAEAAKGKEV